MLDPAGGGRLLEPRPRGIVPHGEVEGAQTVRLPGDDGQIGAHPAVDTLLVLSDLVGFGDLRLGDGLGVEVARAGREVFARQQFQGPRAGNLLPDVVRVGGRQTEFTGPLLQPFQLGLVGDQESSPPVETGGGQSPVHPVDGIVEGLPVQDVQVQGVARAGHERSVPRWRMGPLIVVPATGEGQESASSWRGRCGKVAPSGHHGRGRPAIPYRRGSPYGAGRDCPRGVPGRASTAGGRRHDRGKGWGRCPDGGP